MTLNFRKFILKAMIKRKDAPQNPPKSFLDSAVGKLLRLPVFLLKLVYLIPILLFGLWLLQMLYFPQLEAKKIIEMTRHKKDDKNIFRTILKQDELLAREHFHMVDEYITKPESNPPLCLMCHGTYPHSKEKKVRSILNFHTGFIACAVCHARKKPGDKSINFVWIVRETGEIAAKVQGQYGKYAAKIFPIQITAEGHKKIYRPVDDETARQFLLTKDEYSPDQVAQAKTKMHEHISSEPVFCSDCHKKDGYLDYARLGFPMQRINHLNSSEIVGMIEKYKTFYLPSAIDFGVENSFEK
jgi:hypothetical protein